MAAPVLPSRRRAGDVHAPFDVGASPHVRGALEAIYPGDSGDDGDIITVSDGRPVWHREPFTDASHPRWGIRGNGTTDDSDAIEDMLADPRCARIVVFPEGVYYLGDGTSYLQVAGDKHIIAYGAVFLNDTEGRMFEIKGTLADMIGNVTIEGATFRSDYTPLVPDGTSGPGGTAVRTKYATSVRIVNCEFENLWGAGVSITDSSDVWIRDCRFTDLHLSAVRTDEVDYHCTGITVEGCVARNCQIAARPGHATFELDTTTLFFADMENHYRVHARDNKVFGAGPITDGLGSIRVGIAATAGVIEGNVVQAVNEGIVIGDPGPLTVAHNDIRDCPASTGILVYAVADITNVDILFNKISQSANAGRGITCAFHVNGITYKHVKIMGNTMRGGSIGIHFSLFGGVATNFYRNVLVAWNDYSENTLPIQVTNGSDGSMPNFYDNVTVMATATEGSVATSVDRGRRKDVRVEGQLRHMSGGTLGFYGAAAAAKPTVTGAKGGNAALTDLLAKLSTLGILTDSTT